MKGILLSPEQKDQNYSTLVLFVKLLIQSQFEGLKLEVF